MNLTFLIPSDYKRKKIRLLFLTILMFWGFSANAQQQKVTLTGSDLTLKNVFKLMEQQTNLFIDYDSNELDDSQILTSVPHEGSIHFILTRLLSKEFNVSYQNNHVIISKNNPVEKVIKLRGKVINANGDPIIGANVIEKGTTNGIITDINGDFNISVKKGESLQISYIGYVTHEIVINNQTHLQVKLVEESKVIDEVIVVGYGTQKKTSLTGAVTAIKGDDLRNVPTGNLANAMAGKLSGVSISQSEGGRPGNTSNLTIRARGTWNSTDPLYVIDGVVRDAQAFNALGANEVENISILKDAATAAIYGSRAANGVVLVTTKRGKTGKVTVNYSGSVGMANFALMPERETAMQHIAFTNDHYRESNQNPNATNGNPPMQSNGFSYWPTIYKNGVDASGGYINSDVFADDEIAYYASRKDVDLLKEAYRTPITHNHSIDVSGGTEKVNYFVGVNFYNETGAFKSLNYSKYSIRGNIDAEIAKGLKLEASINTFSTEDKSPAGVNNGIGGRALTQIWEGLIKSSALIPGKIDGKYIGSGGNMEGDNPVALADGARGSIRDRYWNTEYTATLSYDIPWIKGLNVKVMYNKIILQQYYKRFTTPYEVWQLKRKGTNNHIVTDELVYSLQKGDKPSLYESHQTAESYQLNGFINYNNTFGKHEIGVMLGFEQAEKNLENFYASKNNYEVSKPYFNFGPTDKNFYDVGGKGSEDARLSYIGRLTYAYKQLYLFDFSFRRDASVKFASNHRWGFFPAASFAWRLSEESFFGNMKNIFNNIKLRGSVGLTGNDAIGAFQWMDLASINTGGPYYGGSSYSYGVSPGGIANPLITWEKSMSYDVGFDLGILENMFTVDFDYFFRHTYDILGSQTSEIPDTFGGRLSDSNYGVVDSWGYEIGLGFNKQINENIALWAKGNFGFGDNKVVKWAETGVPHHLSKIGKNWDRAVGFQNDGIVQKMIKNSDGTCTVYTSNGNRYDNLPVDYAAYRGPNYNTDAQNKYSWRPGMPFPVDRGSPLGYDENGNAIYSSTPDGKITCDDADKTWIIDRLNPPYNFGLTLGGNWKGLSLEVFFQGFFGHQTLIATGNAAGYGWAEGNWAFWSEDHFSMATNPDGKMPYPTNMGGFNTMGGELYGSTENHAFWVRNASFIRLKNITLAYDFNKKLLAKAKLSAARISLTCNNVALLYNPLKYFDPELARPSNTLTTGVDIPGSGMNSFPLMRTFTLGLNLSF